MCIRDSIYTGLYQIANAQPHYEELAYAMNQWMGGSIGDIYTGLYQIANALTGIDATITSFIENEYAPKWNKTNYRWHMDKSTHRP